MLQHPGLGPSEISASALVPCLSPPGSLTLDDFTHFSPLVKEELRFAIQSKRLSGGMSTAGTTYSGYSSEKPAEMLGMKREVCDECLTSFHFPEQNFTPKERTGFFVMIQFMMFPYSLLSRRWIVGKDDGKGTR